MRLVHGIKRSLWRGLAMLLPALLTLVVLKLGLSLLNEYVGQYVNAAIIKIAALGTRVPSDQVEAWYFAHWLEPVGVAAAVIGLCVVGYFVGTFVGARLIHLAEGAVLHVPILRSIYPSAKQVSEFVFSERKVDFHRVVAVEFPHPGMWMIGFVTGRGLKTLANPAGKELISVFVPFTPAPVTGYVVVVAKDEVVELPMSVDEAIQFLISAGVIVPPSERVPGPDALAASPPAIEAPAAGAKQNAG